MNKKVLIVGLIVGFVLVGVVVGAWFFKQQKDKISVKEANIILMESYDNTLKLNSFTSQTHGDLRIVQGENTLVKFELKDAKMSKINPFNFMKAESNSVFTFNIKVNLKEVANFIEKANKEKTAEQKKATQEALSLMRSLLEVNISTTLAMKSINNDTYIKIIEINGLKEILNQVAGIVMSNMIMTEIDDRTNKWFKYPAPAEIDIKTVNEINNLIKDGLLPIIFNAYNVVEVLPSKEINNNLAYKFKTEIDLNRISGPLSSLIVEFAQKQEEGIITDTEISELSLVLDKAWPIIKDIYDISKITSIVYIDKTERIALKEEVSFKINLGEILEVIEKKHSYLITELTPKEKKEFENIKNLIKDVYIISHMHAKYSEHNAVQEILPPKEYQEVDMLNALNLFENQFNDTNQAMPDVDMQPMPPMQDIDMPPMPDMPPRDFLYMH